MISKAFRVVLVAIIANCALSAAAGATCSNASLSGTYGFLHVSTDSTGTPASAAVSQITFDASAGTFSGETIASRDGVIKTEPLSGTYGVDSNCTGTGTPAAGSSFSIMVTSTGFLALHLSSEGFAVKQGSPTCTDAGIEGNYGFETTGVFTAGPATGAVAFVGELQLSGGGVISGQLASSQDAVFAEESVTGSYTVNPKTCRGRATITPTGLSAMNFDFVIVDGGKELLVIETDANTIVSGTLQR